MSLAPITDPDDHGDADTQLRDTLPDKRKHYAIARGSALECAAILDAAEILKLVEPNVAARGNALLVRVVAMLTKMSR